MAIRFYLVPIISTLVGSRTYRSAKYFGGTGNTPLVDLNLTTGYQARDFGPEDVMIVGADVTPAQHTLLAAQPDCTAIPNPITDQVPNAQVASVRSSLESLKIPGNWVTNATTWQQIMRTVLAVFDFVQPFLVVAQRLYAGGVTLDTTLGSLSSTARNRLTDRATQLGFSTAGLTAGTTLRDALVNVANQYPAFDFMGVSI